MKKASKILLTLMVALLLLMVPTDVSAITDEEFAANEQSYKTLCFENINEDNKAVCQEFQSYMDRKIANQKTEIENLELEIDDIKQNILDYTQDIRDMQEDITQMEAEIVENENGVVRLQTNIEALEEQIVERQAEIDALDEQIKSRMESMQSSMHVRNEITFLFGAKDFSDFIRRTSAVNTVTAFDQDQIDKVTELREKLSNEQEEVMRQQDLLRETINNIQIQKDTVEATKRHMEVLVVEFQKQEAELIEKQAQNQANYRVSQSDRNAIQKGIADLEYRLEQERLAAENEGKDVSMIGVGNGWYYPVVGSFYISAGNWYYPGGGVHYGVDLAGSNNKPVVSTGPGIVVSAGGGCSYGWLGNTCNGMRGNYAVTVVAMPDGLYALKYYHLSSVNVRAGQVISTGTELGKVGSTGNSTGPHLHHEVVYLGKYTLSEYINNIWNGGTNFTPNGAFMNLSWRCTVRGAPCLVNAQQHYGFQVGAYY